MNRYFEQEFLVLRQDLLMMASLALENLKRSIKAYSDRDDNLCGLVENMDTEVDQLEKKLDQECILLLMRRQPLANDLRLVTTTLKIITDFERISDLAVTVARKARDLNQEPVLNVEVNIPEMANLVYQMIDDSIKSFVSGNVELARSILKRDKEVDRLNKKYGDELAAAMADASRIRACLNVMFIARSLERAADHAKNIAEEAVFLCEAVDIRHERSGKGRE